MNKKIDALLEELKFKGMTEVMDQQIKLGEEGAAIQQIIINLLQEELRFRQERSLVNRIRNAKMPWDWTLNSFPFKEQPGVNKNQIMTLAGLDFLQRGENIIFHGKTGVGKSGLAVGILRQALMSGARGRFYDTQRLLDDLYASLADRTTLIQELLSLSLFPGSNINPADPDSLGRFNQLSCYRQLFLPDIIPGSLVPFFHLGQDHGFVSRIHGSLPCPKQSS